MNNPGTFSKIFMNLFSDRPERSECLHNETCNISFVQSASINLNADLLTPESYYRKNETTEVVSKKSNL